MEDKDIYIEYLIDFFRKIKSDSEKVGNGNNGKEFENKIMNLLVDNYTFRRKRWNGKDGSNVITTKTKLDKNEIKSQILKKDFFDPIKNNTNEQGIIIYQPFGSQNYPDFLIFTKKYILPLEIKFSNKDKSKSPRPKWNSNIPKANGLYIFAIAGKKATFFLGSDFIDETTRNLLLQYFDDEILQSNFEEFKNKMLENNNKKSNPFGLRPYIRKDYVYKEEFSTDKTAFKKSIFQYSEENNWEENLIKCLEDFITDNKND